MTQAVRIGRQRSLWDCLLPALHTLASGFFEIVRPGVDRCASTLAEGRKTLASKRTGYAFAEALPQSEAGGTQAALAHDAARAMDDHGSSIFRLAYSYLHNREDSEDILQEVLIRYMRKAPPFENERHERAWLLTVTANLSKNKIKYSRLREWDELDEELIAENRRDLSFVWDAVKSLPVQYRETIHLFYEEGYGSAEIASILGQKDATVRSNLRRGRAKLRSILMEEYDFDGGED